ncbi:MAG: glycosyltransferase family 39 protein [Candidatus Syntropharchaeales archaeon]
MDLLLLLFCLLAPGFFILHSNRLKGEHNGFLSFEERIFYSIIISVAISSCVLIALLSLGCVSTLNLFIVDILVVTLIIVLGKGVSFPSIKFDKNILIPIIFLLVICFAFYSHPSQELSARHDIGVYLNTGIEIGKTGSITVHDAFMASVPDEALPVLFSIHLDPMSEIQGKQFPDMAIIDHYNGSVLPIQPPLFQTWIGIFYSTFGISGIFWVSPFFATLSVIGVYFLSRRAFGKLAGVVSSSLLAICFSQVFFAQYSSPEILFQMLMMTGLLFFMLMWKRPSIIWAVASSLCWGLPFFVRIDAILVILPVTAIFFYGAWHHALPKHWKIFASITALLMGSFIVYAIFYLRPYISQMSTNISKAYGMPLTLDIIMALLFVAIIIFMLIPLLLDRNRNAPESVEQISRRIPWKLVGIVIAAYLVLMLFSSREVDLISGLPRGSVDPFSVLSIFTSPIALVAGIAGVFIVLRERNKTGLLLLLVSSLFLMVYLFTIPNNPAFPWLTRRHVTAVIPVFMIFTGYSVSYLYSKFDRMKRRTQIAGKSALVLMVGGMVLWSVIMLPTLTTTQFDGYSDQIADIASDYDENDVILDSGMLTDATVSMNLKYEYQLNAIYLWDLEPELSQLNNTLQWLLDQGYDVYFFSVSDSRLSTYFQGIKDHRFTKVNEYSIQIDKLQWETCTFTNHRVTIDILIEVYQIMPRI